MSEPAAHGATLERLEEAAERFAAAGAWDDVLATAQLGAHVAWQNHVGRFASPRLEAACMEAGRAGLPSGTWDRPRPSAPGRRERVLHVLTETYESGGHTRAALRWMELDAERIHSLHLTRQRGNLPKMIDREVDVSPLDAPPLQRARRLRSLAADHDLVVLHHHPNDPVPLAAFPHGVERPPIIVFNHADHTFWLGRGLADLLVSYRATGRDIAIARRGVPAGRHAVLPLPVTPPARRAERAASRHKVRCAPGEVLLLTAATPYKFEAPEGRHLLDLVEPVIQAHPNARLIVAGPKDEDRWALGRKRTGGRIEAVGPAVLGPLYAAADVYLESYPCGGSTTLAEAAHHALPVLGYAPDAVEAELLATDPSPAFQRAERAEDYRAALSRLIEDADERRRWSRRAGEEAARRFDSAAWTAQLQAAIAAARAAGPVRPDELGEAPALGDEFDRRLHELNVTGGRQILPADVEMVELLVLAASRNEPLRGAFATLSGPQITPLLQRRFTHALAAPAPTPDGLVDALEALRFLRRSGLVEHGAITVPADAVEEAATVLGPLVDEDDDLDLVPHDAPAELVLEGTLHVRSAGDRFGDAPATAGAAEFDAA